jgi:uncharacterized SAM-binding protein YcdF (DUF218 family)
MTAGAGVPGVEDETDVDGVPAAGRGAGGPPRRRWVAVSLTVATVLAVALAAAAVLSWRWFVRPSVDGAARADAIVMFGGSGDRFDRAVDLADEGYADTIVISDPYNEERRASPYGWFCRNDGSRPGYPVHDYEAICFEPEPQTTRGEARYLADLAAERGWERVVLVTTVDQATRARMLVERCWDGQVATAVVPSGENRLARVLYEWGAMARATLLRRGC